MLSNVISAILTKLGLGNKAKALVPGIAGLVGVLANYIVTGHLDTVSLDSAVTGLVGSVLVYLVPNKSAAPLAQALVEVDHTFSPEYAGHPDRVKS